MVSLVLQNKRAREALMSSLGQAWEDTSQASMFIQGGGLVIEVALALATSGGSTAATLSNNARRATGLIGDVADAVLSFGKSLRGVKDGATSRARKFTGAGEVYVDDAAETVYQRIRASHLDDVFEVANNTGLSIQETKALKKHLFFGKHKLYQNSESWTLERFAADPEIAFAWERAQTTKLNSEGADWFRQLVGHELGERALMARGVPYRNPASWDPKALGGMGRFTSNPPGAHDLAPPQPKYGTFPGFYGW